MTDYASFLSEDRFAIFLFHGVIPEQAHEIRNYTRKHLLRDEFRRIVDELCANGSPISMDDVVAASRGDLALPPRAFAITFDDGFENNYSVAAPLLRTRDVPATFYVTTGFIGSDTASWTDLIEFAVERTPRFELTLVGLEGEYETTGQKIELLDNVRARVKSDPGIDPLDFAAEIWRELGVESFEPDEHLDRKMSWPQVCELSGDALFTIGGHSHTHRIMAFLDRAQLDYEVSKSMGALSKHLGHPVTHYSYPEGMEVSYSDTVIRALRERGIVCAPTAIHGTNRVSDDLFHLKRVSVI